VHVEKPDVDHWDHEGCGCEDVCEDAFTPPPIPENPCAEIKSDTIPGDDRIYTDTINPDDRIYIDTERDSPTFVVKGSRFGSAALKTFVKDIGQREFSRQFGVPRTTLQGWLRKAEAWLNKNKRAKKK
jgi:hypothetical protein